MPWQYRYQNGREQANVSVKYFPANEVNRHHNECPQDGGEICPHCLYQMLAWRTQPNTPCHTAQKPVEERGEEYILTMGISGKGIKGNPGREMGGRVFHQPHVVPCIRPLEDNQVPLKHIAIREKYAQAQSKNENEEYGCSVWPKSGWCDFDVGQDVAHHCQILHQMVSQDKPKLFRPYQPADGQKSRRPTE